jgi:protoporphyrin/coproporphyrin ferrochelatase
MTAAHTGVLLIGHGTVERLDDLPAFLAAIRHGRPAPDDVVREVRRRYEAIGGRSPLNAISNHLAHALEEKLRLPVRACGRLWAPYPGEMLEELAGLVHEVTVLPLAQHSAHVYAEAVRRAEEDREGRGGRPLELVYAPNWGQNAILLDAYAARASDALASIPGSELARTVLVLTAHSLPRSVIEGGDAYEQEVRASAEAIAARVGGLPRHVVAFQSQGMGTGPGGKPMAWLGPDLVTVLDEVKARGDLHVVFAPIGFLADHVEILYDLDIEARGWCKERGLTYTRSRSLNASDALVDALVDVVRRLSM